MYVNCNKNSAGESIVKFDVVMAKTFSLDPSVYKRIAGLYQMENMIVEFVQSDDLLLFKRNGQLIWSFRYIGNNEFEGGTGAQKVRFELLPKDGVKATVTTSEKTVTGEKFLKYS